MALVRDFEVRKFYKNDSPVIPTKSVTQDFSFMSRASFSSDGVDPKTSSSSAFFFFLHCFLLSTLTRSKRRKTEREREGERERER